MPQCICRLIISSVFIQSIVTTNVYKRQSKNVQKWEFKNVQFYSLNISFKR